MVVHIITRFPRHSLGSIIKDILNSKNGTYGQYFQQLFQHKIGWIVYDERYPPLLMFPSFLIKTEKEWKIVKNLKNEIVDVKVK